MKPENRQAFPGESDHQSGNSRFYSSGMVGNDACQSSDAAICKTAYMVADLMLEERSK